MIESQNTADKLIEEMNVTGVITANTMMADLNISRSTASRNFNKINKLYPGSVIKLKDTTINNITYGTGKAINATSSYIYEIWLQEHYFKDEYRESSTNKNNNSLFRKKLESKSKDELIEEIIDLHANLSKVRDSVFNKIDQEINNL